MEPGGADPWRKQDIGNLSLRIYPDSVLRQVCEPVERFDSELRDLLKEMLGLMRAKEGIGLAAPQVGITRRLFVCEIEGHSMSLVNPGIEGGVGSDNMVEGCLSLPDTRVWIPLGVITGFLLLSWFVAEPAFRAGARR